MKLILLTLFAVLAPFFVSAQTQPEQRAAWQVVRYDVVAQVPSPSSAERVLTGKATLTARNVGAGAGRELTIRLNPSADITKAKAGESVTNVRARKDERANLLVATLSLPAAVQPGETTTVTIEYRIPVADNSGIASISGEGAQFLPQVNEPPFTFWYPTPNTPLAPRGADYAPFRLSVTGLSGDVALSAGRVVSEGTFDVPINAQPFFITGKWETVEGTGEARGVSAHIGAGATAEERQRAEALVAFAAAARSFYSGIFGPPPDTPVRMIAVRRGAGFEMAGALLVDQSVFRRPKIDSTTALQVAESVARLWVGGVKGIEGQGAGAVREGLPRFLATLFLEHHLGKDVADKERTRTALLYAAIARRDSALSQATPVLPTYFNSVAYKGSLVWRILTNATGRDAFNSVLRREFAPDRAGNVSLASLRAALGLAGGDSVARLATALFEQPTDTDLLVGLPQPRGNGQAVALRNIGSVEVDVIVQATTDRGERLNARARVPAKDFGEALFQTQAKIVRVEVDPEKLYPQVDYSNDAVPRAPTPEEALGEARAQVTRGEFARAEATAREVLARFPLSEEARIVLGRALLEQNKLDDAEKEFRLALEAKLPTASTLAGANIGLGEIALKRNRQADAAKRFDEAVRIDADYPSTLAARAARIRAESAGGAPPIDESIKAAVAQFDAAIKAGRKADIEPVLVPGELGAFVRGIIGTQPEIWQTRVLRTEVIGANRVAADVAINTRTLGKDSSGTAVLVFSRMSGGWKLSDIQFFEVR